MQLCSPMGFLTAGKFYSKWRSLSTSGWLLVWLVTLDCLRTVVNCDETYRAFGMYDAYTAVVNITFRDPVSGEWKSETKEDGRYAKSSKLGGQSGVVIHIMDKDKNYHGCKPPINTPKNSGKPWIALIQHGTCNVQTKIKNVVLKNASAAVIYDTKNDTSPLDRSLDYDLHDVVSIFITKSKGQRIAALVDNGTRVMMHISVGHQQPAHYTSINKTSVLFVSISFIVLMIISLAWLVFYYIQRFRYAHAKERLSKRLMNAAKKAITKMPVRTIKTGDKETDSDFDQCAVCIESYRPSDVIRILPCKCMGVVIVW